MKRALRSIAAACAALAAVVLAAPAAHAQGVTGSAITGTITGTGGRPVGGAEIQLINPDTGDLFTATTTGNGKYSIDNVPAGGPYIISVSAEGYQVGSRADVVLTLGQRLTVNLALQEGKVEEIVIVETIDKLQDVSRTGPSTTLKESTIKQLPLQGRNFTDLVSVSTPQASGNSIAGQNNRFNNIQIDGGANNDLFGLASSGTPGGQANAKPISVEAIKEFVVQVAPFDVRQSSFVGGLVNAVTKSGTNDFHGALFGYFQNKALGGFSDDNLAEVMTAPFVDFTTWQFGGNVGGPIIKDKLHFFVSADLQQRETGFGGTSISGNDEEDMMRLGFTQATVDQFTQILSGYGITNPGSAASPSLENPDRNIFAKVTTNVITNSRLELSYNFVNASQDILGRNATAPSVPNGVRDGYQLSNSGYQQANDTHTVRAKMTSNFAGGKISNELLAGLSIIRDERALAQKAPLILVKVGRVGSSDTWLAAGGERFSHENLLDQDVFQLQDSVTIATGGNNRVTLGTANEFLSIRNVFFQAAYGAWAFNSLEDFAAGTPLAFQRRLGVPGTEGLGIEPGTAEFSVAQFGLYAQDEMELSDNLTLTFGLRADLPFLSDAPRNDVLLANSPLAIDTSQVPSGNILWSPRIGFNMDLGGDASTILRGGVGIFTGRPPYVWVSNAYSINGLSQVELRCDSMTGLPTFTADPNAQPDACMPGGGGAVRPTNAGEIDYFDPDTKYPQTFRQTLGIDHRFPFGILATGEVLYTADVNGWYITDENLNALGTSGEGRQLYGTFAATGFRATPSRVDTVNLNQAVKVRNESGARVINGTLQLSKAFTNWLDVSLAYTYTSARDRISFTSSQALSNFQFTALDGTIQNRSVTPSAFERPHKITFTGAASLPLGFGVGLTYVGQSGTPYTWRVNGDVNADGVQNDLPFIPASSDQILLQDDPMREGDDYASLDAFIESRDCLRDARGGFLKRGACRNPWQNIVNLRASWTSPALLGQRVEVQFDIFNVMNLLNSDWGRFDQESFFDVHGVQFLRAVGYDQASNRPIYSFTRPTDTQIGGPQYSSANSWWRMQLGARLTF
jgi:hypothetical protein